MAKQEYTFGDESEEQTRSGAVASILAAAVEFFPGTPNYQDSQRMDPRIYIEMGRRMFFQVAQREGLSAHEALHAWVDAIEVEDQASTFVTANHYCIHKLAEKAGMSVEEFRAAHEVEKRRVAELIRQRMGLGPDERMN